jgi:hypothetical protein
MLTRMRLALVQRPAPAAGWRADDLATGSDRSALLTVHEIKVTKEVAGAQAAEC